MNNSTIDQINAINADDFWHHSGQLWARAGVQSACLTAQDQWMADCNVILLIAYLAQKEIAPAPKVLEGLFALSGDAQRAVLRPLRKARAGLKGSNLYDKAKALELLAEKQVQQNLCDFLNNSDKDDVASEPKSENSIVTRCHAMLSDYFTYLSIITPDKQAEKLAVILSDQG